MDSLLQTILKNKQNLTQIGFIAFILLSLYFLSIRPQKKKRDSQRKFLENLKVGMQVITIGGIHGIITIVEDKTITLEVDDQGTILVLDKNAISAENILV